MPFQLEVVVEVELGYCSNNGIAQIQKVEELIQAELCIQ
jgi:hypothetical protein